MPKLNECPSNFSQKLMDLIKQHSISIKEVAHKLGVSESTVRMWKAGQRYPDRNNLRRLCHMFNVPENYFDRTNERLEVLQKELEDKYAEYKQIISEITNPLISNEMRLKLSEKMTALARTIQRLEYDIRIAQQERTYLPVKKVPIVNKNDYVYTMENDPVDSAYVIELNDSVFSSATVFVNSKQKPSPNEMVLIKINGSHELRFYVQDGDITVLQPITTVGNSINVAPDIEIIGTVQRIEINRPERKPATSDETKIQQLIAQARSKGIPKEAITASILRLIAGWPDTKDKKN